MTQLPGRRTFRGVKAPPSRPLAFGGGLNSGAMPDRRRSLRHRITYANATFAGALLFVIWVTSGAYFFWSEHNDLRESVETIASIVATQSSAAVAFDDKAALSDYLAPLKVVQGFRWAIVVAPDARTPKGGGPLLVTVGTPPDNPDVLIERMAAPEDTLDELTQVTIRRRIVHGSRHFGDLVVNVDTSHELTEFMLVMVVSLAVYALYLWGGVHFFGRIVFAITRPLADLMRVADSIARGGSRAARADENHPDEFGHLAKSFNHMLDTVAEHERALSASQADLRALTARIHSVREEERARIAHEIHDELGQRMTMLKFELARMEDQATKARLGKMIDELVKVTRELSWKLRPGVLDSLGLAAAIEWLADDFQKSVGMRCRISVPPHVEVAPELATDVFRICQELLTNVARHARATRAQVTLESTDQGLRLSVEDNGKGLPADVFQRKSLGLLGIRERCQRWGGKLDIGPGEFGTGTLVSVSFPDSGQAMPVETSN